MSKQEIGVIGLAVMGKNLALNIAEHGYKVSVYNRSAEKTEEILKDPESGNVVGTYSIEEFVESLAKPRKIILMVKAGEPVDASIKQLIPHLSEGDIIIDGGNSYYIDTIRRSNELQEKGIHFIGAGISGGEEGARKGPSIMPGGDPNAYKFIEKIITDISAKVDGAPCATYIGKDGAGHFVKMVHNGIEYADMQLICEAYALLKNVLNIEAPQMHEIFKEWSKGELSSYLIDITSDIFTKVDPETGKYLVDLILDVAGQKGTGKWTGQIALDLGVPIPTIVESVFLRYISSIKDERVQASKLLKGPHYKSEKGKEFIETIRKALYASKICAYAQGFGLMSEASKIYNWDLKLGDIAMIFRGGCIIRAQFLNRIKDAYENNPSLPNLLLDNYFNEIISNYQNEWREVIATAISAGIPVPGFASAITYYDSYRTAELSTNLLQAQRDYFGAHTYKRTDKEGVFHTQW